MLGSRNMSSLISVNLSIIKQLEFNSCFFDREENTRRMDEYFMPSFGKSLLGEMYKRFSQGKSGSYLMSGRPGFGKTHLLLFLANFFQSDTSDPLFNIMARVAKDMNLVEMREALGKVLVVAPLPVNQPKDAKFDARIINALNGALARKVVDFIPSATGSAPEILQETINHLKKESDFKGIVIIMDNMEPVITDMEEREKSPLAQQVIEFNKYLQGVEDFPVIFLGCGSFFPNNYTTMGVEEDAVAEVGSCFDQMYWFDYAEDEWADFVIRFLLQQTSPDAMVVLTSNPEFENLAEFIKDVGMYKDKGIEYIKMELLPGCFPLHPFTMELLPKLSQKISRKEKNLLSFFRDTAPGSFRYFLDTFGIFQASGKLSVYTPDYLFSYYESTIKESTALKNIYDSVERAYMLSGNLPLARRVIRLIALMQMIDDDLVRPTKKNIIEALHLSPRDMKNFDPMLVEMVHKGGFVFDRKTQEIKLPVEKTGINLREYLDRRLEEVNRRIDPKSVLVADYNIKNVNPSLYNKRFHTDRKSICSYIDINDLRNEIYVQDLNASLGTGMEKYNGDVAVLYLITADDIELQEARNILSQTEDWGNGRIAVGVPVRPAAFVSLLMEKAALMEMREDQSPFNKPDTPERELLDTELVEIIKQIDEKLKFYLRSDRLYWYHRNEASSKMQNLELSGIVELLLEENFSGFPAVANPAVSHFRDKRSYKNMRRDAVDKILAGLGKVHLPKKISSAHDKLIYDVLVEAGILEEKGPRNGQLEYAVVEGPLDKVNALGVIWNLICGAFSKAREKMGQGMEPGEVVRPLLQQPYGVTPGLLEVLLAAVMAPMGGNINIYLKSRDEMDSPDAPPMEVVPLNYETVSNIVADPENYMAFFTEETGEDRIFVEKIIEIFARKKPAPSEDPRWDDGMKAVLSWYEGLPLLTRNSHSFKTPYAVDFLEALRDIDKEISGEDFHKEVLPEVFGFKSGSFSFQEYALEILTRIKDVYIEIFRYFKTRKLGLVKAVQKIFAGKDGDFEEMFIQWRDSVYPEIDLEQVSPDAKFLLEIDKTGDLEEQFLVQVPDKMGFGPFARWESNKAMEYLNRISQAKLEISLFDVVKTFSFPEKEGSPEEMARKTMEFVFEKFNIPMEEREVYLIDLMEKTVWE